MHDMPESERLSFPERRDNSGNDLKRYRRPPPERPLEPLKFELVVCHEPPAVGPPEFFVITGFGVLGRGLVCALPPPLFGTTT